MDNNELLSLVEQLPATLTVGDRKFFRAIVSVGQEIVVKYREGFLVSGSIPAKDGWVFEWPKSDCVKGQ